jgi:hypothetical protein
MARPGSSIPPVTLYADKEQVENAFKKATKPWICIHCRESFSLLESMGSLSCEQHPGYVQEDGKWSCCGQRLYPMRWAENADIQRMFIGDGCPQVVPKVRGCQLADHNTSDKHWNHKDAYEIANLSALLPFMNKEFPFQLRKGFEQGVMRRCARRPMHVPLVLGAIVTYLNNDGQEEEYTVDYYEEEGKIRFLDDDGEEQVYIPTRNAPLPPNVNLRPEGMEQRARTENGQAILDWW